MKEKLAYYFENWKTIPNLISFIRILLIPVFAVLFYKGYTVASVIILAVSGFSDLVDGKIARKLNQISNLGKMLDPIADKLTVFAIAIILFLKFNFMKRIIAECRGKINRKVQFTKNKDRAPS